jgi:hypothetical protein
MSPLEFADEWLHTHRLAWLSKALGICWVMNRRLDAMERES